MYVVYVVDMGCHVRDATAFQTVVSNMIHVVYVVAPTRAANVGTTARLGGSMLADCAMVMTRAALAVMG
jgi:hypothetical protein